MRHDDLHVGKPFWVIQIFDQDGYYSSVKALDEATVKEKTGKRTAALKGLRATTIPFEGKWEGSTPDVSVPADFKEGMADLDRPMREE